MYPHSLLRTCRPRRDRGGARDGSITDDATHDAEYKVIIIEFAALQRKARDWKDTKNNKTAMKQRKEV